MGYSDESNNAHKTGRIALLCGMLAFLGLFVFLFKVDACSTSPEKCKDEFFEIRSDNANNHSCSVGAIIETVSSPPAPKPGILCHCPKNPGAPQAEAPVHTN